MHTRRLSRAGVAAVAATLTILGAGAGAAHADASAPVSAPAAACQQSGTLTVDGAELDVHSPAPGVGNCYTFQGAAGAELTIGIYLPGASGERLGFASKLTVRDPAGQVVASFHGGSWQVQPIYRLAVPRLKTAGTYTVEVAPVAPDGLVAARLLLNSVRDLGRVDIDGPGKFVHLKRIGQEQRITFAGRADQWVQLELADFDFASGTPGREAGVWIEIWSADRSRLLFRDVLRGDGRREMGPLRVTSDFVVQAWSEWGSVGGATISIPSMPPQS
ncbi:PPC domain-containing protein [Bailinhaonella thermotolerans]|uniref:Uncharacterized protein n=1 Tax=Bailinhaonella thermotolerans TaxID=1070861 RepID=A0A3A4BQ24_9ACTN|nr:PPC domain-containing protein [Bailinhaonella thermotolerans]RJL33246.1 hypothetical protein D5H75_10490 [Bailinhaonella thermotolerans]